MSDPRYNALDLAIRTATVDTTPAQIVDTARMFHGFLTGSDAAPVADAKPAKPAAGVTKAADPKPETRAADPKPATKVKAEPTEAEVKTLVVKLVTKIGRDPTIAFMNDTFGGGNVTAAQAAGHALSQIKAGLDAKIAQPVSEPAA